MVWGSGLGILVLELGFSFWDSWFGVRVRGLGLMDWDSGIRVQERWRITWQRRCKMTCELGLCSCSLNS